MPALLLPRGSRPRPRTAPIVPDTCVPAGGVGGQTAVQALSGRGQACRQRAEEQERRCKHSAGSLAVGVKGVAIRVCAGAGVHVAGVAIKVPAVAGQGVGGSGRPRGRAWGAAGQCHGRRSQPAPLPSRSLLPPSTLQRRLTCRRDSLRGAGERGRAVQWERVRREPGTWRPAHPALSMRPSPRALARAAAPLPSSSPPPARSQGFCQMLSRRSGWSICRWPRVASPAEVRT